MLKRSFVLFLTLAFLYNSGYVSVLGVLKEKLYRSFESRASTRDGYLLRFSKKDPLISLASDRKELARAGRMYDVVKQDAGFYYCWHDSEEEGLVSKIAECVKEQLDKGKAGSSGKRNSKIFVKDYLVAGTELSYRAAPFAGTCFFYNINILYKGFSTLVMPPPWIA